MNKLPRYHIIIRIVTGAVLRKVMELLTASDENQDGGQLRIFSCITERDTCVAMLNISFNYQHTYMCMLIIIRMIYILQKNEIYRTAN